MRSGVGAAAVAAALVAVLTGCEAQGADKDKDAEKMVASTVTVCAKNAVSVALPAGFPANFPLPAGTIITTAQDRGSAGLVVEGVTATSFSKVLHGLQADLPAKGFTPANGETEPRDAESNWSSAGYQGRWAIRELSQCGGQTSVSVVARKK